ncbi:MAG: gliding motility-associated C-terminal domain-containing protein [Bacteroidia bacterium]
MKHCYLIRYIFALLILAPLAGNAQSTLVYSEDFENGNGSFSLNTAGEVGTNTGTNQWIVNNQYSGAPTYPNTPDQTNTTGGNINFAPFSNYLHIHDSLAAVTPGVSNANFNPQAASDRFASTTPFCTLGLDSVRIAFFFHCVGAPGATGSLYYQADGGPWTAVPNAVFSGQANWAFVEFYNEDFDNKNDLRFGFRWTNGSAATTPTGSFGVDGIRVVGRFAPALYNVRLEIDSITPNPVCRGDGMLIFFSNPVPLCGTGFYEVQMSNLFGDFTNYTSLGIFQLSNENTNMAVFTLPTPTNLNVGDCYLIRIMRVDITPVIVSDVSICIEVINCPNQIFTLEPPVVSNPLDTICIGSVIDVPFYSTGVYLNNTYIAQLSDSNGLFPPNPNVLGFINDNNNYPPGTIPRGNVPGLVQPQQQPIPPGCNYYIRVISSSPSVIGSVYGPFCIRNCDIETNDKVDVSFCIDNENGGDTLLSVDVGIDPPPAEYFPVNEFEIQLLDFMSFGVINTGVVGSVEAYGDTVVQLSIPILPLLGTVGLIPGTYYMRIVASNSSQPWDNLGTLVRLTIGAPNPSPLDIDIIDINTFLSLNFDGDTTICVDEALFFRLAPYNPNSTYQWGLNNDPDFYDGAPYNGILFNQAGEYDIYVVETNYGCVGPGSVPAHVTVRDLPSATVVGPSLVCEGDTVEYDVPLSENTYYEWGINPGSIVDSSSNVAQLYFTQPGTTVITMSTVNECGNRNSTRNITVRPLPDVIASNDTIICAQETVQLSTPEGNNYMYYWSEDGDVFSQQHQVEVTPDSTTTYYIRVTSFGSLQCENMDSVTVEVQYPDTGTVTTIEICEGESATLLSDTSAISYLWSTGETSPFITVSDSGWYTLTLYYNEIVCAQTDSFHVKIIPCYLPLILPNVFTPNGDGFNDFFKAIQTFDYDEFNITIWNRWGIKVYESEDPFFEWNGKDKNGDVLPDGTYFFVASLKHLENEDTQKGTVTILDSKK